MAGTNFAAAVTSTLNAFLTDNDGLIILAECTGAPPTTASIFAHGAICRRVDSGTGTKAIYENIGSSAVPSWDLMGAVTAGEITLAEGSVLVGNNLGVAVALDAKGDGKIMIGNGTTITSQSISGDATLSNAGALTVTGLTSGTATVRTSVTASLALAGTQGYGLDMSGTFTNHMIYIHPTALTAGKRAIRLGDYGGEIALAAGDGLYRSYAKVTSGTDVSAISFLWQYTETTGSIIGTQSQTESWTTVTGPQTVMDHDSIVGIAAGKSLNTSANTTEGLIAGRFKVYADVTSTCNGHVSAVWLDSQMSCAVGGTESSIRASTGGSKPDAFAWLTTTSSGWSQLFYLDATMAAAEPFVATGCSVTVATVPYLKVLVNATQYGIPLIAI